MECIIGSFTYVVIVNLIIIYHIIAQVLLDYTKLRFEFFCQDCPSINSWVRHCPWPAGIAAYGIDSISLASAPSPVLPSLLRA